MFFKILYDSFKKDDDKERYLREQYDSENGNLMKILANNSKNTNMNALRDDITQWLLQNFGPDQYKNLKDALNGMYQKGFISTEDKNLARDLNFKDDKHLLAAWDTYVVMNDEEDFANTLQILCDVKRDK